jgi:hypothetical protein
MSNVSTNGAAVAIIVIEAILSAIGVEFEPGSIAKLVEGAFVAVALIFAVRNQLTRSDIKAFFLRK